MRSSVSLTLMMPAVRGRLWPEELSMQADPFTTPIPFWSKVQGRLRGTVHLWVIGSPRSGTTYLAHCLGLNTDLSLIEPNELPLYARGKVEQWRFPLCRSVTFKWCENFVVADRILDRFPDSLFLHAVRDPLNNIQSIAFPKADAWPPRAFEELGEETESRIGQAIDKWVTYTRGCLEVGERFPGRYLAVPYADMPASFPEIERRSGISLKKTVDYRGRDMEASALKALLPAWEKNTEAQTLAERCDAVVREAMAARQ